MLREFYNYIANNIIKYFQMHNDIIQPGERFCLHFDNDEILNGVNEALKSITEEHHIQGHYEYGEVYSTFTIKVSVDKEIVIAAKINTEEDFLAKLRNVKRTEKDFPILMLITQSALDTIESGTADLAAQGMPFHLTTLMNEIDENIAKAQFSVFDEAIMKTEMSRKRNDRYNDKSSLYEYRELLTVLERGYVLDSDYPEFGLLVDPDGKSIVDSVKANERISKNRELFEKIDRIVKYGDVEEQLSKEFDKPFVDHLVQAKKKGNKWYEGYTLTMVQTSLDRMKRKLDNPLDIKDSDFTFYSGSPIEHSFVIDETAFIRPDGESKAQQRKKNILIYDRECHDEVIVEIATNITVKQSWVEFWGASVTASGKQILIKIKPDGCSFAQVNVKDSQNGITYQIRICVLGIDSNYLDRIRTAYMLAVSKQNLSRSKIQVMGIDRELVINPGQENEMVLLLENNGEYECNYNQTLHLKLDNSEVNGDTGKTDCKIRCGSTVVPIELQDEPVKPVELTGTSLFKWKHEKRRTLEYREGNFICGTEKFFARDPFRTSLSIEEMFVSNGWLAICEEEDGYKEIPLHVSGKIVSAYANLIEEMRKKHTVPSATLYVGKMRELAEIYLSTVLEEVNGLSVGVALNSSNNDLLFLGCVLRKYDDYVIKMSPLSPMNIMYQLELYKEESVGTVRDKLVEKLTPLYLMPYFKDENKVLYHAVEQKHSPEWREYAPVAQRRFQGSKNYVQKLIADKINQYREHFSFLFRDLDNNLLCINLVNMGDCREVFQGLIRFFNDEIKDKMPDEILEFVINIYSNEYMHNTFSVLEDSKRLRGYLENNEIAFDDINEMEHLITRNIRCYFRNPLQTSYEYAHLTFYEMPMAEEVGTGRVDSIVTGISLGGITSGTPSVLNSGWYKTGFGIKHAPNTALVDFAKKMNAMVSVAFSGSSYEPDSCIFTEVEKNQETQQKKIYDSSNWVVFVDPKVDLTFFQKKAEADNELMIIHYSDQYTSASGYDDITVTQKSSQYNQIIKEQLEKKGVSATKEQISQIINLFNAINGSWMLKLITAKKLSGAADSNFSREKMSILSAIKLCMAYYSHKQIVWIPISLEEMLRVSGGAGLSQRDGLLSARNLGFEQRPTSDDILMVGIEGPADDIKVYLHPVEVKIGINSQTTINKAQEQVINTYTSLHRALWPDEGKDSLECRLSRNFFMQLLLVSCEKFKLYNVYPDEEWDLVINEYREALLNEKYRLSDRMDQYIGKGTVISFKTDCLLKNGGISNDVCLLEFPEKMGSEYMVCSASEIEMYIKDESDLPKRLCKLYSSDVGMEAVREVKESGMVSEETSIDLSQIQVSNANETKDMDADVVSEIETQDSFVEEIGMKVCFGTDKGTGNELLWMPNDTDQIFHTNMGIIGTMGTGKTQFTKSIITQLHRSCMYNVEAHDVGILIFDYKGDYNQSKEDFIDATSAKVYQPYHLPFNPLALTKSKVFKPLLPIHTANAFKDTLSKAYGLGPKQQDTLFQCIIETYHACGIIEHDPSTWDNEPPTFEQVYQRYANDEEIKKNDSLAAAMNKLHQFQIFESVASETEALFDLLKGVVVIDLSIFDPDVQNLIVAIVLDLFYSQMQAAGSSKMEGKYRQLTKMILVDEADNFMSQGFPSLKKILKEGREFGVGTILSTQFLNHFGTGDDDYSKYILTWVVHNVSDLKASDVEFVFKTESKSQESICLFNDIKKLNKHNSIVKIGNNRPQYIIDRAFWELWKDIKNS